MSQQSYIFKVQLSPQVWREIQINDSDTLDDLHRIIIKAYDFDDDHLYAFFMDNRLWSKAQAYGSPYFDSFKNAAEMPLNDLDLKVGDEFMYLFDFGDSWEFKVKVVNKIPILVDEPLIIETKGEAPPQYEYNDDDWDEDWEEF